MSRGLSGAMIAALQEQVLRPAIFFEGAFASGTLRLWSGLGERVWNGHLWTGAGTLLGLSQVVETTEIVASGTTVSLSGVPVDLVSACISDFRQGLPGKAWVGLLDSSGAIVPDPFLLFAGRADMSDLQDDADTCVILISYESRLIDLQRPREWRYTHESQQQISPGDQGFEFVAALQDKKIVWGMPS